MLERNKNFRLGVTLIELLVAIISATVLMIGLTAIIASGHSNFKSMFNRTSTGVVPDAYVAKIAFDRYVRQASIKRFDPSTADNPATPSNFLYVYFYSNPQDLSIADPDKYARFYLNGTTLMVTEGDVLSNFGAYPGLPNLSAPTKTLILANNVASVAFKVFMYSVEMTLVLDNENIVPAPADPVAALKMTVTATAIMHNDWH